MKPVDSNYMDFISIVVLIVKIYCNSCDRDTELHKNETRSMSLLKKGYPNPALIISLEIVGTGIIFLNAHPEVQ